MTQPVTNLPTEETYPPVANVAWGAFYRAVKAVLPFASRDTTRENLSRVLVRGSVDDGGQSKIVVVATDGHRLCEVTVQADVSQPFSVLVSRDTLQTLCKVRPSKACDGIGCRLTVDDRKRATFHFQGGTATLDAVNEGSDGELRFPPYTEVFPKAHVTPAKSIGIDPRYLADVGRSAAYVGEDLRVSTRAELDPVLFEIENHVREDYRLACRMIVMPRRIH